MHTPYIVRQKKPGVPRTERGHTCVPILAKPRKTPISQPSGQISNIPIVIFFINMQSFYENFNSLAIKLREM